MKKWIWRIVIAFLVAILIVGGVFAYRKSHSKKDDDIIIKDNVQVITDETAKENKPVRVNENNLIFEKDPGYKKGDVIVSGSISTAKNGFIRKVVGKENDQEYCVVKTEYALLTDVFERAHIVRQFKVQDSKMSGAQYNIPNNSDDIILTDISKKKDSEKSENEDLDYMFNKSFEEKEDPWTFSGNAGASLWVEVDIDIEHGDIQCAMALRNKGEVTLDLRCGTSTTKEAEKEILKKSLPTVEFLVGTVPIVITNRLEILAGAEFNLEGNIGLSYEATTDNTVGFQYNSKNNKVKDIKELSGESDGIKWNTAKITGDSSANLDLHYIGKFYDLSGLDMSVGVIGKAEGESRLTTNMELENGYAGSLDLSVGPQIEGKIVADVPVFAEGLLEQPIFEVDLDPFWSKHWESSKDWKSDLEGAGGEEKKILGMGNKYTTRYGDVNLIDCPTFQFEYPNNWKIESEEVNENLSNAEMGDIEEKVVIVNERGVTVTYWSCQKELGGYSREWVKAEISKVEESEFIPGIVDAPDSDYSNLGNFMVAKVQVTGEMDPALSEDYEPVDNIEFFAVVPESYLGEREFAGQAGQVDEFSFEYPSPHAFIAESPDGTFTKQEEREVIKILKSFKESDYQ